MKARLLALLCRIGWHAETVSQEYVYYTAVRCRHCSYARNFTVWDGWNP